MLFSLIAHRIASVVQDSALGPVDRTLGFVFGLVRGAAIVCVTYLIYAWMVPPAEFPSWLREARALPLAQAGGAVLLDLVPGARDAAPHLRDPELRIGIDDLLPRRDTGSPAPESERQPDGAAPPVDRTAPDAGPAAGAQDPAGYDRRSRQQLENLIDFAGRQAVRRFDTGLAGGESGRVPAPRQCPERSARTTGPGTLRLEAELSR